MQNKYFFIFYFFISYNLINTMDFTDDFANLQQQSIMLQSSPLSTKKINHLSNLLFFSSPEIESCLLDLQFLENFPVYRQQFSIKCLQQGCNSIVKSKKNLDMLVKLIKSHMNTKHPSTPPYTNEEFMEYINKFHTKKPILSQRTDKKGIHFSLICPYCNQIFNNLLRKGLIFLFTKRHMKLKHPTIKCNMKDITIEEPKNVLAGYSILCPEENCKTIIQRKDMQQLKKKISQHLIGNHAYEIDNAKNYIDNNIIRIFIPNSAFCSA